MYRTGDLGSWREDGQIEIHGRVDDQVKVKVSWIEADGCGLKNSWWRIPIENLLVTVTNELPMALGVSYRTGRSIRHDSVRSRNISSDDIAH